MPMPATPLSAIDVISPALERAKQQLFQPFRWGFWLRMALVAFLGGEVGGSGVGGFNGFNGFNLPQSQGNDRSRHFVGAPVFDHDFLMHALPWIFLLALALFALFLVFLYLHSVFRFILFDSVLRGQCGIRAGWSRWHECGARYFLWLLLFQLLSLAVLVLVVGIPLYAWWKAGIFQDPGAHMGLLLTGGLFLLLFFLVFSLIAGVVSVTARDFLIPRMALENLSVGEAWRRFEPMLFGNKTSFAAYFGMKILLAIAVGIVVGLINLIVILILLIPIVLVVVVFVALAHSINQVVLIALAVVAGVLLFMGLLFLMALVSVPAAVFIQSYAQYFYGSRYAMLGDLLWPAAPPAWPDMGGGLPDAPAF